MNRLVLALRVFWKALTDPAVAARVESALVQAPPGPDLRVLAVLQRDGRLVDFLLEDIDGYADHDIGAAVRDIHRGCRKALRDYLAFEPVLPGAEESPVTIYPDFDPAAVRLIGNVTGSPPFQGTLKHHGWRVKGAHLPAAPATKDGVVIVAPAEVEVA